MKIQTVLISGKQGSGKTTLMNELCKRELHKVAVLPVNFADPLREMHDAVLGVLQNYGIKREIRKDGPLMQVLGTEWARKSLGEDIWIRLCKKETDGIETGFFERLGFERILFIIGDCRFKNEFEAFPEALRVRLRCPREVRKLRCEMWREIETHPSEVDLDGQDEKFDVVFDTHINSTSHIATMIEAQLLKDNWIEKRQKTLPIGSHYLGTTPNAPRMTR